MGNAEYMGSNFDIENIFLQWKTKYKPW